MDYERPAIASRRDITAELSQGVKTSTVIGGDVAGVNPKWRHTEKTD